MICPIPFLIGTNELSEQELSVGLELFTAAWGGISLEINCCENPHQVLGKLPDAHGIARLYGDAARFNPKWGSW